MARQMIFLRAYLLIMVFSPVYANSTPPSVLPTQRLDIKENKQNGSRSALRQELTDLLEDLAHSAIDEIAALSSIVEKEFVLEDTVQDDLSACMQRRCTELQETVLFLQTGKVPQMPEYQVIVDELMCVTGRLIGFLAHIQKLLLTVVPELYAREKQNIFIKADKALLRDACRYARLCILNSKQSIAQIGTLTKKFYETQSDLPGVQQSK